MGDDGDLRYIASLSTTEHSLLSSIRHDACSVTGVVRRRRVPYHEGDAQCRSYPEAVDAKVRQLLRRSFDVKAGLGGLERPN